MRYGVPWGEPWDVDKGSMGAVGDAVEVPQGLTKRQRDHLRKRRRRKQRTGEEAATPVQRVAEATAPPIRVAEAAAPQKQPVETAPPPERVAGEVASVPPERVAG